MIADAVICGAGIAGIAAAYHLSVRRGLRDVVIVDELPPLSHFTVVIHCVADDSADVYVFRSFGASLWEWLRGGAEEFGYTVE